jgi:hypothetical protein
VTGNSKETSLVTAVNQGNGPACALRGSMRHSARPSPCDYGRGVMASRRQQYAAICSYRVLETAAARSLRNPESMFRRWPEPSVNVR